MADDKTAEKTQDDLETLRREIAELRGTNASYQSALSEERNRRISAERARMSDAERHVASQQDACEEAISRLEREAEDIVARIAELADEPGHGKEVSELTRRLTRSEAQLIAETQRKDYLSAERDRAKSQTEAVQPSEKVLANGAPLANFSPAQRSWLEAHPKALTDTVYLNRVNAAANAATNLDGISPDSPAWFARIEELIGEGRNVSRETSAEEGTEVTIESPYSGRREPVRQEASDQEGDEISYTPAKPQHRAAGAGAISAALPPSRTIPGGTAQGAKRTPALTPEEREVADSLYTTLPNPADRYAKYVQDRDFMKSRQPSYFVN